MELWVRIQNNKALLQVNSLFITQRNEVAASENFILGKYDTKERCLEILDEIQKQIDSPYLFVCKDRFTSALELEQEIEIGKRSGCISLPPDTEVLYRNGTTIVYQMPEK